MKPLIFDSSALLAYFFGEEGYEEVLKILKMAAREDARLLLSPVNLGEVYYVTKRRGGEEKAQEALKMIDSLFFEMPVVDIETSIMTGKVKLDYGLGYADAFAAALALKHKGELVAKDPDFRPLDKEIKIHWIK